MKVKTNEEKLKQLKKYLEHPKMEEGSKMHKKILAEIERIEKVIKDEYAEEFEAMQKDVEEIEDLPVPIKKKEKEVKPSEIKSKEEIISDDTPIEEEVTLPKVEKEAKPSDLPNKEREIAREKIIIPNYESKKSLPYELRESTTLPVEHVKRTHEQVKAMAPEDRGLWDTLSYNEDIIKLQKRIKNLYERKKKMKNQSSEWWNCKEAIGRVREDLFDAKEMWRREYQHNRDLWFEAYLEKQEQIAMRQIVSMDKLSHIMTAALKRQIITEQQNEADLALAEETFDELEEDSVMEKPEEEGEIDPADIGKIQKEYNPKADFEVTGKISDQPINKPVRAYRSVDQIVEKADEKGGKLRCPACKKWFVNLKTHLRKKKCREALIQT